MKWFPFKEIDLILFPPPDLLSEKLCYLSSGWLFCFLFPLFLYVMCFLLFILTCVNVRVSQPVSGELLVGELHRGSVQQCLPHVHLLHRQREVQRECPCLGSKSCSSSRNLVAKGWRWPGASYAHCKCAWTLSPFPFFSRCLRKCPPSSPSSSSAWWKLCWQEKKLGSLWKNRPCYWSSWITVLTVWCVALRQSARPWEPTLLIFYSVSVATRFFVLFFLKQLSHSSVDYIHLYIGAWI